MFNKKENETKDISNHIEEVETRKNGKNRKKYWIIAVPICVLLLLCAGYHGYSHYMVSQFYKYIDAEDTEGAIACIEKMPNVNSLDVSVPMYFIRGVFTQNALNRGYPLYYAIYKKADISVIESLLAKGADPNKKYYSYSETPLHCLCRNPQKDRYEKVKLLIEYGADINDGYIHIPASWEEMTEDSKEQTFRTIVFLWENGVDEWRAVGTKYERSILHIIAESFESDYLEKMYKNQKRPMNELLDSKDANGETALFRAIRAEKFDNYAFLVEEGADTTIQNNEGKTAYDIAVELGYEDRLENKSETDEVLEKIKVNNPYFYTNDDVNLTATFTYRDLEEQIVRDGTLNMKLVKNYENGDLFKLSVDDKEKIQECLSEDRLNVYFYVTEDEIYRLWSYIYQDEEVIRFYNDDDMIVKYLDTDDKLIANGELVCCKESIPDKLDWPESGSHVDIIQQNDQVEYDRVDLNANGDRQFYERFIWEKGKGLVEFRSGFRVEADILYIENITKQ